MLAIFALMSLVLACVGLYGVEARDVATFFTVPVVLATTALMATIAPALRATRVDPMTALRSD